MVPSLLTPTRKTSFPNFLITKRAGILRKSFRRSEVSFFTFSLVFLFFFVVSADRCRMCSLQVYHHSSMVMLSEYACTYGNWPAISVPLGLNGIIHVFLYYYYGYSALNPGQRPAWKKNLTQLQLIQFMIGLCHMVVGYLQHGWCYYGIIYEMTMIWLFSNFYYHSYLKERATVKKVE